MSRNKAIIDIQARIKRIIVTNITEPKVVVGLLRSPFTVSPILGYTASIPSGIGML
jgi:hypothetical protein